MSNGWIETLRRIAVGAQRCLDNGTDKDCRIALEACRDMANAATLPPADAPGADQKRRLKRRLVAQTMVQMATALGRPNLMLDPPCSFQEGIERVRILIHEANVANVVPDGQSATYKLLFETASGQPLGEPREPPGDPDKFFREYTG